MPTSYEVGILYYRYMDEKFQSATVPPPSTVSPS